MHVTLRKEDHPRTSYVHARLADSFLCLWELKLGTHAMPFRYSRSSCKGLKRWMNVLALSARERLRSSFIHDMELCNLKNLTLAASEASVTRATCHLTML